MAAPAGPTSASAAAPAPRGGEGGGQGLSPRPAPVGRLEKGERGWGRVRAGKVALVAARRRESPRDGDAAPLRT